MAISPPSDIVLDVANAVSRTDLEAARAELRAKVESRVGARVAAEPFEAGAPRAAGMSPPSPGDAQKPGADAFVRFEAMVLQTFVQSMLPEKADAVYGEGLSGDMWKSLLARELGETLAANGGIGIADRLLADYYKEGDAVVPVAGVASGAAREDAAQKTMLSTAVVQELQRTLMQSLARDDEMAATGVTAATRA